MVFNFQVSLIIMSFFFLQITFASPNEDELIAMANALSCKEVFHPIQRGNIGIKSSIESLFQMLKPAILVLLEKGIKVIVLTLGSDGVFLCSKEGPDNLNLVLPKGNKPHGSSSQLYELMTESCPSNQFLNTATSSSKTYLFVLHLPALPATVARLTGAGDCLVGGTLASMCAGLNLLQSVAVGIAAAKAAVEAETNVPAEYCLAKIAGMCTLFKSDDFLSELPSAVKRMLRSCNSNHEFMFILDVLEGL